MAKFDLFNTDSWAHIVSSNQQTIKDKVMGTLGNKIGDLRDLRKKITTEFEKNEAINNVEYDTALTLTEEESNLMNVNIYYPDDEVNKVLESCDKILKIWENKSKTAFNVIPLIDELKIIQPYMNGNRWHYIMSEKFKNLNNLTKIKVTGNSLWIKFIEAKQRAVYWQNKHDELLTNTLEACSYYELSSELNKRPEHDLDY